MEKRENKTKKAIKEYIYVFFRDLNCCSSNEKKKKLYSCFVLIITYSVMTFR